MKTLCIYDNHIKPNVFIKNIIGEKSFGEVILKRKSIKSNFFGFLNKETLVDEVLVFDYDWQLSGILEKLRAYGKDTHVIHFFSQFVVQDEDAGRVLFQKVPYIIGNYLCLTYQSVPFAFMMDNMTDYCDFMKYAGSSLDDIQVYSKYNYIFETISANAFYNVGDHGNFLQYISGGFDTRFFNSVKGDEYVVTKSSQDKKKISAEYHFFHLLPDYMKMWFVMPYNYQETEAFASYDMERYHMTDLAIRWVHGAINLEEMDKLLTKAFRFINTRQKMEISEFQYNEIESEIYLQKLDERMEKLKSHEAYDLFRSYVSAGTVYADIDAIVSRYKTLYREITGGMDKQFYSVIGHGDLCFSNMLFNKETDLLKLIDPKGAVDESGLWTNPYYDIAKLSHSICGKYDFFNNGLFSIQLDQDLEFKLIIDFDNCEFKRVFKRYVEESGYSYEAVRIYEVSLFLSMLPLHMDNPQKVFGFILNALEIMEEIETCMRK